MKYRPYVVIFLCALLGLAVGVGASAVFAQESSVVQVQPAPASPGPVFVQNDPVAAPAQNPVQNQVQQQVQLPPQISQPASQSASQQAQAQNAPRAQQNQGQTQSQARNQSASQTQTDNEAPYALYRNGQYAQAISQADDLIRADRQNISAYAVKGWAQLALKRWSDALTTANQAYVFVKNDRRIVEIMAEAHYEMGNYDQALPFFERYLALAPNGQLAGWVYYFIGMIYVNKQKFAKADIALSAAVETEKARGNAPKVEWLLSIAQVKERRQRASEALAAYRAVLAADAGNAAARAAVTRLGG